MGSTKELQLTEFLKKNLKRLLRGVALLHVLRFFLGNDDDTQRVKIAEKVHIRISDSSGRQGKKKQFGWKLAGLAVLISRQILNGSQDFFFPL